MARRNLSLNNKSVNRVTPKIIINKKSISRIDDSNKSLADNIFLETLHELSQKIQKNVLLERMDLILEMVELDSTSRVKLAINMLNLTIDCENNTFKNSVLKAYILVTSFNYSLHFSDKFKYYNLNLTFLENQKSISEINSLNLEFCCENLHYSKFTNILDKIQESYLFNCDNSTKPDIIQKHIKKSLNTISILNTNSEDLNATIIAAHNNIQLCSDIDAMFGSLSFLNARSVFKNLIEFDFNVKKKSFIFCKTSLVIFEGKYKNINTLEHYKIGSLNTTGGLVSLFYVCPNIRNTSNENVIFSFLKKLFLDIKSENLAKNSIRNNSIKVDSVCFELKTFEIEEVFDHFEKFKSTQKSHLNDFLYVESFGNKNKLACSGTKSLDVFAALYNVFDLNCFPNLQVDLAVSLNYHKNAVFLHPSFFDNLFVQPEYFILFNTCFANINKKMFNLNNNELEFLCSPSISKINFYSSLQDILAFKDTSHMPTYSLSLLKTNLHQYNLCGSEKNLIKEYKKFVDLIENLKSSSNLSWSYRLELRINPIAIIDILELLVEKVNCHNVICMETNTFMLKIISNCEVFFNEMNKMSNYNFMTIYDIMSVEYLFTKGFCNGTSNMNILPLELHRFARTLFTGKLGYSNLKIDFSNLYSLVSQDTKKETIVKLLKYDKTLSEKMLIVFLNLLNISNLSVFEAVELILKQYIVDISEKFRIENNFDNLDIFKSSINEIDILDSVDNADIDNIILRTFGYSDDLKWKKFAFRCLIDEFIFSRNIDIKVFLNEIKKFLITKNIDLLFNIGFFNKKISISVKKTFCFLKNFSGNSFNFNSLTFENNILKKTELYNQFINCNVSERIRSRNVWTREEEIRLISARKYYWQKNMHYKGVWTWLEKSAVFGFIFIKSATNMKFKYSNLIKNKILYDEYNESIFNPENFQLSLKIQNLRDCGYDLNDNQITIYKELLRIELGEYNQFQALNSILEISEVVEKENIITPSLNETNLLFAQLELFRSEIKTLEITIENQSEKIEVFNKKISLLISLIEKNNFSNPNQQVKTIDATQNFSLGSDNFHVPISPTLKNLYINALDNKNSSDEIDVSSKILVKSKNIDLSSEELSILSKLYKVFKFNIFSLTNSRKLVFSGKNRLSISSWRSSVIKLCKFGYIISKENEELILNSSVCKTNPRIMDNNYDRLLQKFGLEKSFTSSAAKKILFNSQNSLSNLDWEEYLNSLIFLNLLETINSDSTKKLFKLKK